jgi:hypothetical protein
MAKGFAEIGAEADNLDKREWLGLLLDREVNWTPFVGPRGVEFKV